MDTIENTNPNIEYYLAYFNKEVIGITGFYELPNYPDDIFIGRFGLLPDYRDNGFGKRIFLDTINMVYKLDKKYLRIIVNNKIHIKLDRLCKNYMDKEEVYNEDTTIYSKNLTKENMPLWNKRMLDIENE